MRFEIPNVPFRDVASIWNVPLIVSLRRPGALP
jgi:hypothetical protein